jgi:hypothetical protein
VDPQTTFKFLEETRLQCRFAQFAWSNVRSGLQAFDAERSFFYVHAFLSHAGAISRLLWPDRDSSKPRGECLRQELAVPDNSPLRLRELRPHLEKADELYEDWLATLEYKGYVDMNLMPQTALGSSRPDTFQRDLDPDTFRLSFRGVPIELRAVADAVRQLDATSAVWMKTHKPW